MEINENSGAVISLEEAKKLVKNFKEKFPEEINAFYIGKTKIQQVLDQQDCIGVRIFNGYDEIENKKNIVIIGVDENGNDKTNGIILDRAKLCPSLCGSGLLD